MYGPQDIWTENGHLFQGRQVLLVVVVLVAVVISYVATRKQSHGKQPPWLTETIPHVTNIYQYWTNMGAFLSRAGQALEKSSVVKFYMGPARAYLVSGSANLKNILRAPVSSIDNSVLLVLTAANLWGWTSKDVARIKQDVSGRGKKPQPGAEHLAERDRFFFQQHHIYNQFLTQHRAANRLAEVFYQLLCANLDARQPIGSSRTVGVLELLRTDGTDAAIRTLVGSQIFEHHPDFVQVFWDYETRAITLFLGVPRWLNRRAYRARDRLNLIIKDYMRLADASGSDGDKEVETGDEFWDERTGSRVFRELRNWFKEYNYDDANAPGFFSAFVFGQNANSIPIATWVVMESIQQPALFRALQDEIRGVFSADTANANAHHKVDIPKLLALPLLNSVYTETLRFHMTLAIPRATSAPLVMDGFAIDAGALLLVPIEVAHRDEASWGVDGHPAAEFWGERHVRYVDDGGGAARRAEFALRGDPNTFFPYGGGSGICPGRHFAKQEIFMILAVLLAKFDVEFEEWTMRDGRKSERPARDDGDYAGAAGMPPDRDMKVRLVRRW